MKLVWSAMTSVFCPCVGVSLLQFIQILFPALYAMFICPCAGVHLKGNAGSINLVEVTLYLCCWLTRALGSKILCALCIFNQTWLYTPIQFPWNWNPWFWVYFTFNCFTCLSFKGGDLPTFPCSGRMAFERVYFIRSTLGGSTRWFLVTCFVEGYQGAFC